MNPYIFAMAILIEKGVQFVLAPINLNSLYTQPDE